MSTVKISQLPTLASLDANTSNSLFMGVDVTSGVTGKFTSHTLAQGLFSNEILNVGNNQTFLPNTVAQFYASGESYIQTNLVNSDDGGTADIVVTANTGTDSTFFIDFGFANKDFVPGFEFNNLGTAIYPMDGYLYVQGEEGELGGNLTIGTTTTNTEIKFVAGGHDDANIIAKIAHGGFYLQNGHGINFEDGSTQTHSATFAESFANGAFVRANSAYEAGNTSTVFAGNAYDKANSGATFANGSFTRANSGYGVANSAASFANGAFVMANSSYDKANSGATFANAAFTRANSGYATANSGSDFANGAFVMANSSYDQANAAYGHANTSLQNTSSIVVDTNLTVPGTLTVSGAMYAANTIRTPNIFPGSQTAITLSFQNSGLVKANIAADLAITLTSFVPGKFVDVFITNTTGQGKTITHGCSAINSTVGATTFTLAATRTAYLRYTSFNSELANAVVAITYA